MIRPARPHNARTANPTRRLLEGSALVTVHMSTVETEDTVTHRGHDADLIENILFAFFIDQLIVESRVGLRAGYQRSAFSARHERLQLVFCCFCEQHTS